jgi:hypothetical protein
MAPDLTFGPDGNHWHYNWSTKTYDLTRGTKTTGHTFKTTYGPDDTFVSITPELSALVIVDMQNFFLHPRCREHPTGLAAVEPTLKLIAKCRELGIQASPDISTTCYLYRCPSKPHSFAPWVALNLNEKSSCLSPGWQTA